MSDGCDWKLTAHLSGISFEHLRHVAKYILGEIATAKTPHNFPISGGGGSSYDGNDYNWRVEWSSPVEAQIKRLREEADKLEATLGTKP